jgi:hypothetical protein
MQNASSLRKNKGITGKEHQLNQANESASCRPLLPWILAWFGDVIAQGATTCLGIADFASWFAGFGAS